MVSGGLLAEGWLGPRGFTSGIEPAAPTRASPAAFGPGTLLAGRYRLASVVARRPGATLFNALDERSRQRVRVWIVPGALEADATSVAPELGTPHPSFPAILEVGGVGTTRYLVQAWFDGAPLDLTPAAGVPMGAPQVAAWARRAVDLLTALEALHAAGGVHGAIGSGGVWEAHDGRRWIVDLGLGCRDDATASPEALREQPLDARSDLYSLACLLFAMAQGGLPFGTDPLAVAGGHLEARVPDADNLPPELGAILRTALSKQPHHRYASAARMRAAFESALRPEAAPRPPQPFAEPEAPSPSVEPVSWEGTLDPVPVRQRRPVRRTARRATPGPWWWLVGLVGLVASAAAWLALLGLLSALWSL